MKANILLLLLGLLSASSLQAQETTQKEASSSLPPVGVAWSLTDCINYALQNNIDVQQRSLNVEDNRIKLSTARLSRLPDLNASLGGDASFGRSSSTNNTYVSANQTSGSFGVSASLPVFQGLRINRQIESGKLNLAAATQDLQRTSEDLAVNVMTLYLQVLFNKELVGMAEKQLALSTLQTERSRELVATGKSPESALYESEALRAKDELTLTQNRNNFTLALLNLSQALNRENAAGFDVVSPALDSLSIESMHKLGDPDAIYNYAEAHLPHVQAERYRLQSSMNSVRIAKADLYPSISMSGGYGTGVYSTNPDPFGAQIRHNSREYVGASMNIPIFNRRATRNNIKSAQLALRSQQLTLTDTEQFLRKAIEQAYCNADAALLKYRSADKALSSARIAFTYEEEKAAAGRSTIFDYNDAKTRMERAESELIQAKYDFIFCSKILDYYKGMPLYL